MNISMSLTEHWLEIVVGIYLLGMILYGHHKGFIRLAVSAAALFITLMGVKYSVPYVTEWLKHDTSVYEIMKDKIADKIQLDDIINNCEQNNHIQKEAEGDIINELPISGQMKRLLKENNNQDVYQMVGADVFADYIGGYLADLILKIMIFVILFVGFFLILRILIIWLDLIAKLPILSGINQIAGAVLGGIEALIFIWALSLVLTLLSGTGVGSMIIEQVENSKWLSLLYNHNLLIELFLGVIRGMA